MEVIWVAFGFLVSGSAGMNLKIRRLVVFIKFEF